MSSSKTSNMSRKPNSSGIEGGTTKTDASRAGGSRRRRRVTRPEPGSLYDLMHEHAGESLYVVPICWTDRHTKLLGAHFVELAPVLKPIPGKRFSGWNEPSPTARTLSRNLNMLLDVNGPRPDGKAHVIKNIMSTLFPTTFSKPKSAAELDIYFGSRVFRKAIRVPVVWKYPESAGTSFDSAVTRLATSFNNTQTSSGMAPPCHLSPMMAYIGKSHLAHIRQNLFRICPGPIFGDKQNAPVSSLQRLRSNLLIPACADHDAHFVSILLALAQARFYNDTASRASSQSSSRSGTAIDTLPEKFHDVKVQLLTHSDDTTEFIVYTAVVSAAFLERFARPFKAPKAAGDGGDAELAESGMKISFARVPIWPVLGLKERLGKAIGRELVGDEVFTVDDGEDIETWETEEERLWRQHERLKRERMRILQYRLEKQRKRQREERQIIAEVLHSSFEFEDEDAEAEDDDRPVLSPSAKRRCTRSVGTLEVC